MFLLLKLYLAHLIADFILQFEGLYRLKLKNSAGHLIHVFIHFLISMILVMPYLQSPLVWALVIMIPAVHYVQDRIKYSLQKKKPKNTFIYFTADQIIHFLVISIALFVPESSQVKGFPDFTLLNSIYTDPRITLFAIVFILGTFGGSYFLHAFRISYLADSRPDHFITDFEVLHAVVERTTIAGIFLLTPSPMIWAAIPLVGLFRLFSIRLRSWLDFALSFSYAAILGSLFRLWI